ncbi:hypothetical protein KY285_027335 [Solanum tuberosum]|nr:hypothetical protein KY289_027539 [Solanum tuberosum]KAH0666129.1 hypothetical protein KY285_027335 [Solanum tuberosum]
MPVAASAVYFLNLRGDVLINRLYRDDVGYVPTLSARISGSLWYHSDLDPQQKIGQFAASNRLPIFLQK